MIEKVKKFAIEKHKSINQKLWGLIWNTVSWSIYFSLNRVLRIKIDELTIWETELD